jgi:hypothetical protein
LPLIWNQSGDKSGDKSIKTKEISTQTPRKNTRGHDKNPHPKKKLEVAVFG